MDRQSSYLHRCQPIPRPLDRWLDTFVQHISSRVSNLRISQAWQRDGTFAISPRPPARTTSSHDGVVCPWGPYQSSSALFGVPQARPPGNFSQQSGLRKFWEAGDVYLFTHQQERKYLTFYHRSFVQVFFPRAPLPHDLRGLYAAYTAITYQSPAWCLALGMRRSVVLAAVAEPSSVAGILALMPLLMNMGPESQNPGSQQWPAAPFSGVAGSCPYLTPALDGAG